jgi:hypothetical protein
MKKYIQDSLLLTKEDIANSILRQRIEQAARYGLTLEQFMNAIEKGLVVSELAQSSQPTGSL